MTDKKTSESSKPTFRIDLSFKDQILRELEKATTEREESVQSMNASESESLLAESEVPTEEVTDGVIDLDEIERHTATGDGLSNEEINAVVAEIEANFEPNLSDEETNSNQELADSQEPDLTQQDVSIEDTELIESEEIERQVSEPDLAESEAELEDEDVAIQDEEDYLEDDHDEEDFEIPENEEESEIENEVIDEDEVDDESEEDEEPHLKKKKAMKNKEVKDRNTKIKDISNRIVVILVSIIVLVALLLAFMGWRYVATGVQPLDSTSEEYVQVEIPEGSGNKLIGQILEEAGVIKSGTIFNYYTKFNNKTNFLSGYYNLQPSMSLDEIIAALQEGGTSEPSQPVLGKILIPEGYTIDQIAKAIEKNANSDKDEKTPFTSKEFLKVVKDESFIAAMVEKYPTLLANLPDANTATYQLEGYLFPATYDYYEDTTIEQVVEEMIAAMDRNLAAYYDDIEANGFDVNEILTLASLVEKEGSTDEDRKNIAGVFVNRMNQLIPLGSNISILYITGDLGSSKVTLADDASIDTTIDSPYNTYQNQGLMPGPVDSPGLSAIKAAISPNKHDDLYFVADVTTGDVYFADTLEEHEENVEKYVNSKLESSSSTEDSSSD